MTTQPHVAIAILNYNGKKHLESYLPFLVNLTYSNYSVWIIDNQSTDDSINFVKKNYPDFKTIINESNGGFAAGYNEGLQHIDADYYVLLNSDVEVSTGFLNPVIDLMEQDKSIAFAQPKILWLRDRTKFEYAGGAGGVIDALGYPFCRGRVLETLETDTQQFNDNKSIFWASGACMFARVTVYKELKGMYPLFFMQNEEIDMCWRAQNLGYKNAVCGSSTVWHLGGGSLEWENPKKTYYTFRNNLIMLSRNMPVSNLIWLIPFRTGLDFIAAFRYYLSGKANIGKAVFSGNFAYWKWLFGKNHDRKFASKRGFLNTCKGIYKGSIVWQYMIKKQTTYTEITNNKIT